jgi:tRNA(fMet)-specific endonuclease VapC
LGLIVDTNALSAILDGEPAIAPALKRASLLAIPVITLGEYRFGISQSKRRAEHETSLQRNLRLYRVLNITEETSEHYAQLRLVLKQAGTPIPSNDLWIAALCRQHDFPVLSKDRHFDRVKGLRRVEW